MLFSSRIRDRNIHVIYAVVLLIGIAYGVSTGVISIHLEGLHFTKAEMGGLAASFASGIVLLSMPAGTLVRKFGGKPVLLSCLAGYTVCAGIFPMCTTFAPIAIARFFDGAFSVGVWVSCETILLARSDSKNKAFVMSLYAMAFAIGYVVGPVSAKPIVHHASTSTAFYSAAILAVCAFIVAARALEGGEPSAEHGSAEGKTDGKKSTSAPFTVFWRVKTSCLATFSYGYFQASVVLFLPLYLMEAKSVAREDTILITAFFAAGMLVFSTIMGRAGDRFGHLAVMRALAAVGAVMVASFVLLTSFWTMCIMVFVAGASLASISPVSLALQGVVTPPEDLPRANAFYNAFFAAGMLLGPPISGWLFSKYDGAAMLWHLAALWCGFVTFTIIFASDDPRAARARARSTPAVP